MARFSQNLGGGRGGGGGGSFTGTNCLGELPLVPGDCFFCLEASDFQEGEFWVFPEPLSDREDDEDKVGDVNRGTGGGRDGGGGTMKLMTESGDLDFKLVGLKFAGGERVLDTEVVGEGDFEDGYDGVLELKLLLPKLSTLKL